MKRNTQLMFTPPNPETSTKSTTILEIEKEIERHKKLVDYYFRCLSSENK